MPEEQRSKPVLLIIDDSKTFLKMFRTPDLTDYFDITIIQYQVRYKLENILAKIKQADPDYLLLDVNLGASGKSQDILREATEQGCIQPECVIRIITQETGDQQDTSSIISTFTKINIQTNTRLLSKPISAVRLRAELLDESIYIPEGVLDNDFPLPFRVLSRSGKVAFHDEQWPGMDDPAPDDFPEWLQDRAIPDQKKYAGSFPGNPGEKNSGYQIFSFLLKQEGETFLGQIAVTSPLSEVSDNLQKTLTTIFDTMKKAGFYRGRYYRLTPLAKHTKNEEFNILMELLKAEPKPAGCKLPYPFPLIGELKKRFGEPLNPDKVNKEILEKQLVFTIRQKKADQKADDRLINRLNKLLEIDKSKVQSWLEIPVFVRDYENLSFEKPGYRMAGLLIFDQYNPETAGQVIDQEKVNKKRVKAIEQQLLSLLYLLNLTLKKEQSKKLRNYEYSMRQMDKQLAKQFDLQERYQLVLNELLKHSKADTGILTIKTENTLKVVACLGEKLPVCIKKVCFPLKAEHYMLCSSFKHNQNAVSQDYQQEPHSDTMLQAIKTQGELGLTAQEMEEFIPWVKSIHSAVAIPVKLDEKNAIGSIALQYFTPHAVTTRRLSSVYTTLHRVRWVMQQALQEEEQQQLDKIISHDLRSNLFTMQQNITLFEHEYQELVTDSDCFRQLKRYLQDSIDQTENLLKQWDSDMATTYQSFTPDKAIQDYLDMCKIQLRNDAINCTVTPDWKDPFWSIQINLNKEIFARIIRNLLHNSFKYGRKAVDRLGDESQPVQVEIKATHTETQWRISVINPGHMNQEEYDARFREQPKFMTTVRDGSHTGLSAVKFWANKMDCGLELENIDANRVQAILTCPVYSE